MVMVGASNQRKPNINIRLKILSIETMTRPAFDNGLHFLDIIAVDDLGDRIDIVVRNQIMNKYEQLLHEQEPYVIKNAFVCNNPNKNKLAHWLHDSKLMITNKSSLIPVPATEWTGSDGFKFIPFSDLITCQLPEKATADVIGRVYFYNREPKSYGNSTQEKSQYINLELKNLDGEIVSCTLFAKYMTKFLTLMKEIPDNQCVVLIIQFGRTAKFGNHLTVGTDWSFSRIYIDTDLPAIKDFKQSIEAMYNTDDSEQTLGPSLTPTLTPPVKSLEEWFSGAFYVECCNLSFDNKVSQKATTVSKDVDLTIDIDQQLSLKRKYWFKVSVRVADENGVATLTLFESQVLKYVKVSAYTLAKALPEDQDLSVELDALIDNTLLFKIEVSGYNKKYSTSNYTIKDATTDPVFVEKYNEQIKIDKSKISTLSIKEDTSEFSQSAKVFDAFYINPCLYITDIDLYYATSFNFTSYSEI
ncbi:uncharacterized protein [Rutidosis leptorrhynchoides]|uniref:uncharacterized protein n=1 Tax=Rutidosis leptorrhynchoides TaxID=125765 RepID=UPI003A996E10